MSFSPPQASPPMGGLDNETPPPLERNGTLETAAMTESPESQQAGDEDLISMAAFQNNSIPLRRAVSTPTSETSSPNKSLMYGHRPVGAWNNLYIETQEEDMSEGDLSDEDQILIPSNAVDDGELLENIFADLSRFSPDAKEEEDSSEVGDLTPRSLVRTIDFDFPGLTSDATTPTVNSAFKFRRPARSSGTTPRSGGDIQPELYEQIPIRRQFSVPQTQKDHERRDLDARLSWTSPRHRSKGRGRQSNNDRSIFAPERRRGHDRQELVLSWTNSLTSGSSMAEDEIVELAAQLATPKVRNARWRIGKIPSIGRTPSPAFVGRIRGENEARSEAMDSSSDDENQLILSNVETPSPASSEKINALGDEEAGLKNVDSGTPIRDYSNGRFSGILHEPGVQVILYLSTFAIIGSTLRIYIGRLFGYDCEYPDAIGDFITPLSQHICVTSSGRTQRAGGAIFTDLPSNMLGSFVMGLITSVRKDEWSPLPWLSEDHPLQHHLHLNVAISAGFCGSLTTFASWNSQMVVMLDGTYTDGGTPQIASGIFGYIIGLQCAVASLLFGRMVSKWLYRWKNPELVRDIGDEESPEDKGRGGVQSSPHLRKRKQSISEPRRRIVTQPSLSLTGGCRRIWATQRCTPHIILSVLIVLFVLLIMADFALDVRFYRTMWLSALITPAGALLRWKLALLNEPTAIAHPRHRWDFIPRGTLCANVLGSILSALMAGLHFRYFADDSAQSGWLLSAIEACRIGLAGSLSTVSTYVGEVVMITETHPHHAKHIYYAFGTIALCCALGLAVFMPIVRL